MTVATFAGRRREHPGEGGFGRPCRPRRQAGRPQYGRPAARDALRPVQGRETEQRQSVRRLDSQRAREVVKKELVGTASGSLSIQTATRSRTSSGTRSRRMASCRITITKAGIGA